MPSPKSIKTTDTSNAAKTALSPRKQPLQPRAVETVACILEAAAQLLEVQGFEGFNTNIVAERAGVSIGSLYQYFPGKRALVVALMRREKERFGQDASAALAAATGSDAMRHLVRAAVRQQLERPELARLLDIEEARPEVQRETEEASGVRALLRATLDREDLPMQPDKEIATDELMVLIRALVDSAGERRESDLPGLESRLSGAVFGYLEGAAATFK